jgi:hypothetical protein
VNFSDENISVLRSVLSQGRLTGLWLKRVHPGPEADSGRPEILFSAPETTRINFAAEAPDWAFQPAGLKILARDLAAGWWLPV